MMPILGLLPAWLTHGLPAPILPNPVVAVLASLFVGSVWFPDHVSRRRTLRIADARWALLTRACLCLLHRAWAVMVCRAGKTTTPRPTVALAIAAVLADYLLLDHFNTVIWPYLWVKPGIFILMGCFALCLCFPELCSGILSLRVVGLIMIFVGECYLLHSGRVALQHPSPLALVHLVGVAGTVGAMMLSYANQIRPKNTRAALPLPSDVPYVAAIVPTYGEPLDVLDATVAALKRLEYPAERLCIVISDDGQREAVQDLAAAQGVAYNRGPRRDAKAGNLNAALDYVAQLCPRASLVLTQDADEIIDSSFLHKVVGYFTDPMVAFVQTPKDVVTPQGDPFGTRDRIFYDAIQPGRNGAGAAISCGSGVLWRIPAVRAIGGFSTWNVVEDLTTSYLLHSAGYRSEYHNEHLSVGLAPDDIPGLLKQRGTWAVDTWRLFLFDNPLRKPGLSLHQRLQYFELCLFYVTAAFFTPLLMLVPLLSLATGHFIPIEGSALVPWALLSLLYYAAAAQGSTRFLLRMWQYRVGHWPTYVHAFWIAARSCRVKPRYVVTRKTRQHGFYGHLLWPQFLYLIAGGGVLIRAAVWMPEANLANRLANMAVLAFFMFMVSGICRAAFYGWGGRLRMALQTMGTRVLAGCNRLSGRRPSASLSEPPRTTMKAAPRGNPSCITCRTQWTRPHDARTQREEIPPR